MMLVVTYDVDTSDAAGQKRLRKVAKICERHGMRVQNSVFEVLVDAAHLVILKNELEKLISYTKTPAYEERIAKSVKQLVEKYPLEGCELRFAPHDNVLAEKAAKAFGHGCTVAEDRDIVIGGFVLVHRGQGIYLDETLDSALEEQKTWFYQNSGLSID